MALEAYGSTTFVTPNTMKRRPSLTVCTHTDDDCYNCQRCKRQKFAARKEESNISLWEYDTAFQTSKNKQNNNDDDDDEMARLCRNGYHEHIPVDGVDTLTNHRTANATTKLTGETRTATSPKVHFNFTGISHIVMREEDDNS